MDLQLLHDRTGLPKRKLRYCLDHQLIPGLHIEIAQGEVGRPRKFHDDVGFGIVCAAHLLELGLKHDTIRHFLGGIAKIPVEKGAYKSALVLILEKNLPAVAELGDGFNVRLLQDHFPDWAQWVAPGNPAQISPDYQPLTMIRLDLGRIYKQVCGKS